MLTERKYKLHCYWDWPNLMVIKWPYMKNDRGCFGHYCYVSDSFFVPRTWGWRPENIKKRLVFLSTSDRFIFQDSIWAVGEEIQTSKIWWKRQADLRLFVQFGRFGLWVWLSVKTKQILRCSSSEAEVVLYPTISIIHHLFLFAINIFELKIRIKLSP